MSESAKLLESTKMEVRSILQGAPRGSLMEPFQKDYRSMIGKNLPFRQLGYQSPEDFLRHIPDVVYMQWCPQANSYLLTAIATEATKHIEKLVSKQKVSKSSNPLANVRIPGALRRVLLKAPPRFRPVVQKPFMPPSVRLKIQQALQNSPPGFSLHDFMNAYQKLHDTFLNFEHLGFVCIEDCLEAVPGVYLRMSGGKLGVFSEVSNYRQENTRLKKPHQGTHHTSPVINQLMSKPPTPSPVKKVEEPLPIERQSAHSEISDTMKQNFRKILKIYPSGIKATEFPQSYKAVTHHDLKIAEFGYFNLIDMVDAHPEIFKRCRPDGCKDDWLLFDANATVKDDKPIPKPDDGIEANSVYKDLVNNNVIRILMEKPEGIFLEDFIHLYSLNCRTTLDLNRLGFDTLEKFLTCVSRQVSLKFDSDCGKKKVCLEQRSTTPIAAPGKGIWAASTDAIPSDAVLPGRDYEKQTISKDCFGKEEYVPVYLATVVHPGRMWINLTGTDTSDALTDLMTNIDEFYNNPSGDAYKINDCHIIIGTVCAGIWSGDGCWHRILIVGISSDMTSVDAQFVDYGTLAKVPKRNLRYLKGEFLNLPAQAIMCKMAHLLPKPNQPWDVRVRDRLLELCSDKPMMSQFIRVPNETEINIWMCDTSGDDDVHINMLLVKEGYAIFEEAKEPCATSSAIQSSHEIPLYSSRPDRYTQFSPQTSSSSPGMQNPNALMNAYVAAYAAAAATTGQSNGDLCSLMMNLLSLGRGEGTATHPNANVLGGHNFLGINPGLLNQFLTRDMMHALGQQLQSLAKSPLTGNPLPFGSTPPPPEMRPPNYKPSTPRDTRVGVSAYQVPSNSANYDEGDIFGDEDEAEVVEAVTRHKNVVIERFVLRLKLQDGYVFHIIVYKEKPYVTAGDVARFCWKNEDDDMLYRKLRGKEVALTSITIKEHDCPDIFKQIICYEVRGIKSSFEGKIVEIYPLKNVIDILNILGHPSRTIRDEMLKELMLFNICDPIWKNFAKPHIPSNEAETVTDNNKFITMCVCDLKVAAESLRYKRMKMVMELVNAQNGMEDSLVQEIRELEGQCNNYEKRIGEIASITREFNYKSNFRFEEGFVCERV